MTLSNEYQSTLPPSQGGSEGSAPPSYGGGVATGTPVSYTDATQQPVQIPLKPLGPWSTGLCDCFQDTSNCCMTCWCPCVTFGRIAEMVDKGATSCGASGALYTLISCLIGCPCCYSCFYRSKMREQLRLKPSPCGDCLVHCFCESCALCQEYRELKNRGYNMVIGWQGNAERQNRGMEMEQVPPVVEGGMSRSDPTWKSTT